MNEKFFENQNESFQRLFPTEAFCERLKNSEKNLNELSYVNIKHKNICVNKQIPTEKDFESSEIIKEFPNKISNDCNAIYRYQGASLSESVNKQIPTEKDFESSEIIKEFPNKISNDCYAIYRYQGASLSESVNKQIPNEKDFESSEIIKEFPNKISNDCNAIYRYQGASLSERYEHGLSMDQLPNFSVFAYVLTALIVKRRQLHAYLSSQKTVIELLIAYIAVIKTFTEPLFLYPSSAKPDTDFRYLKYCSEEFHALFQQFKNMQRTNKKKAKETIESFGMQRTNKKKAKKTIESFGPRIPITVELLRRAAEAAGHEIGRLFNDRLNDNLVLAYITVFPDDIRMRIDIPVTLYSDLHQLEERPSKI